MTVNSRCYAWAVLVVMFAALNGCNKQDGQEEQEITPATTTTAAPPAIKLGVSDQCVLIVEELNLVAGQTVEYCNKRSQRVELKFTVPGFLPDGALTLTLEPDTCITYVVDAGVVDGSYEWSLTCEGYTGPGGGGPVIVDNPPPGP